EAQAAIDRGVLSRPLHARTRVFTIQDATRALSDFDAFVDAAARNHIVHLERDASLVTSMREQLEAELRRSASERDNVFVLRFMKAGAISSRFAARTQVELAETLKLDAEVSQKLDDAVTGALGEQR